MRIGDSWAVAWPELRDRLDEVGATARWAREEPTLRKMARVDDLARATARGADRGEADAVLAALVRLAAADGPGDDDALLVLLHLLRNAVGALCRELAYLTDDIEVTVLGELACQIRSYPWRRRTRAVAANLKGETRRALLREYRPWQYAHPPVRVEFWDPTARPWLALVARRSAVEDAVQDVDIVELFTWAARRGVPGEDLALLISTERRRAERPGVAQDQAIAAEHGLALRTFYRRRERTLAALRAAARDYLAAA